MSSSLMRVVHLPVYDDNPYQRLLMEAQRNLGVETINGGGGGNFLGTALRSWKADVLHFHWLHPYLLRESKWATVSRATRFLAEIALLKQRGSRIAWTIHNLANHEGRHRRLEQAFTRGFARLIDASIAHSHAAADAAQTAFGIPATKLHVIPHGNYISVYPDTLDRATARSRLNLAKQDFVFLFLGRIEPYKGIFDLIQAFAPLPGHCRLLIAGNPADQATSDQIQTAAHNDPRIAFFPGRVPDQDLQLYFHAADVAVFPYRRVLTSGALALAQSFGKAIIAPRLGGIPEAMGGDSGWLFEPTENGSLGATLQKALTDPHGAEKQIRSRARAEEWPWTKVAEETFRLYQTITLAKLS